MIQNLTFSELSTLFRSVFGLESLERGLTILIDLPDSNVPDSAEWADRRRIAVEWFVELSNHARELPFDDVRLCTYGNVRTNNNDLPPTVSISSRTSASHALRGETVALEEVLKNTSVVLALTELSATAPLKNLAKKFGFRGATLPGFSRRMLPTLALDYEKVHARVMQFKSRLDEAKEAFIVFSVLGKQYDMLFDLRHRTAHASGGLMREPGVVGNLPSGEAYIVPYEGERTDDPSKTAGTLPVQFGDEIVLYNITANKATDVLTQGPRSEEERKKLTAEPAYGNIAEIGIGVLGEWGVTPVGSILLDEKLGLHIAFGRSEHFGGVTSPASFRDPKNVVHIDRVYIPTIQPLVHVEEVAFVYASGNRETILKSGMYTV